MSPISLFLSIVDDNKDGKLSMEEVIDHYGLFPPFSLSTFDQ
jgi:hypothetical protein